MSEPLSSNERLESVLATFTHEQLVRHCASLSAALDSNSLDSDSGEARMLLERWLAEYKGRPARNVRLARDTEAFLNGRAADEDKT